MDEIEKHYNKFNEEKRLTRKHGQVEFITSMKYIHKYLDILAKENNINDKSEIKIMDIGAGTGRYSVALSDEGYDVTAVEYVKHNLGLLKAKKSAVKAYQGTAVNLKRFKDSDYDLTLLFGPMYHLFGFDDKLKALNEAVRITKPGGIVLVAYCMNEYCVLTYAFKQNHIKECLENGKLSEDFHCIQEKQDLYDYVRLDDIDKLNEAAGVKRLQIISADGPADYMRQILNAMDDETFNHFIEYHLATCERPELIGAGAHTLDILRV
jgi:ubiquinone/menaquinone biosynthesis C-methylase UbiE